MHRDGRAFCSVLLLPLGPGHGTEAALCAHATGPHAHSPGRKGAPRGALAAPGAGTAPQLPGRCEDSSRVCGTHRMRPRGLWPRCPNGPREQQDAGVPRTPTTRGGRGGRCSRRAVHPTAPGRPGPSEAPLWPPLCPAPAEARGGHRVRPHPARGRGQRGRVEDVGAGGPVPPLPQRGGGSAPLGDTRRRDHAPRPPVRTETRACPGARGVRGVPRLERARAGTTQGGRATGRLGSRPSGSRPSLQPHCVHVARAMGREGPGLPGSRPPDRRLHDPGRAARAAIRTPMRVYLEGARTQTGCPRGQRLICPRACVAGAVPGGGGAGRPPRG